MTIFYNVQSIQVEQHRELYQKSYVALQGFKVQNPYKGETTEECFPLKTIGESTIPITTHVFFVFSKLLIGQFKISQPFFLPDILTYICSLLIVTIKYSIFYNIIFL